MRILKKKTPLFHGPLYVVLMMHWHPWKDKHTILVTFVGNHVHRALKVREDFHYDLLSYSL